MLTLIGGKDASIILRMSNQTIRQTDPSLARGLARRTVKTIDEIVHQKDRYLSSKLKASGTLGSRYRGACQALGKAMGTLQICRLTQGEKRQSQTHYLIWDATPHHVSARLPTAVLLLPPLRKTHPPARFRSESEQFPLASLSLIPATPRSSHQTESSQSMGF